LLGKAKIEREINANKNGEGKQSHSASLPIVSVKTLKENTVVIPHIGSLIIAKVFYFK
jgi:hypothetical protein